MLFISLYFEVFLLITYFETKEKRFTALSYSTKVWPSVSIVVPCWNEERTLSKTVDSILALDYPKERLSVYIVDDGSTDGTWKVASVFSKNPQVTLLKKENGGKHTALNLALEKIKSEFVGCLDADSFVSRDALKKIINKFDDERIMAVTPAMKVFEANTIIQKIQKIEYMVGILLRNILSHLDSQYVTPGPFTIFRKKVFDEIGAYRHAHNTEDLEIALRIQSSGYRISNVFDAYVYTVAPKTVRALYKQRLRWTYGFMRNIIDYRFLFFKPQYGNLGMFVLPMAGFSLFSSVYIASEFVASSLSNVMNKFLEIKTIGLNFYTPSFDLFYLNTETAALASIVALLGWVSIMFFAVRLSEGKFRPNMSILYFLVLYVFLAPSWVLKAFYNTVFAKSTKWR